MERAGNLRVATTLHIRGRGLVAVGFPEGFLWLGAPLRLYRAGLPVLDTVLGGFETVHTTLRSPRGDPSLAIRLPGVTPGQIRAGDELRVVRGG